MVTALKGRRNSVGVMLLALAAMLIALLDRSDDGTSQASLVRDGTSPSLAGYLHTSGNGLYDGSGRRVRIAGVNWYGFETTSFVVGGLWIADYRSILDLVKNLGYNTVRLPLSNEMVESNPTPSGIAFSGPNGPINQDLIGLRSLEVLDRIVAYAGQSGLMVVLDNHRSEAGNGAQSSGLWYTAAYSEGAWIDDWRSVAQRYRGNPTVVGFDLRNEPHTPAGSLTALGPRGAMDRPMIGD